jgi:hypothetical protein
MSGLHMLEHNKRHAVDYCFLLEQFSIINIISVGLSGRAVWGVDLGGRRIIKKKIKSH